jgi:hypothetical protein
MSEANGKARLASKVNKTTVYPAAKRPRNGRSGSPLDRYPGPASSQRVPGGEVHELPADLHKALAANPVRSVPGRTSCL